MDIALLHLVEEDSNLKQTIQFTKCPLEREFYSNIYNIWSSRRMTCDKPQSSKQLCSRRVFQDGGHSHSTGPAGTGRPTIQTKINLKDAYFAISTHQSHQKYLPSCDSKMAQSGVRAASTCVWIESSSFLVALTARETSNLRKLSSCSVQDATTGEECMHSLILGNQYILA